LASEPQADPIDVVCGCLIEDKSATRVPVTSISKHDVRDILCSPQALVGSDGNCVADCGVTSQGQPHPRFFSTFPRILGHYVG
jgi:N-acyl-D-aspartate/D-glutamate deacylase